MREHGGRIAIHLRGRRLSGRELYEAALACGEMAGATGSLLVVNDRVDVALCCGCGGVQSGARSLALRDIRMLSGGRLLLGRSVHSVEEALSAQQEGADFLLGGTLYSTPSHPEVAPAGTGWIRELSALSIPLIGIGGISAGRVPEVLEAGAYGVAVIRAVWDAPNPVGAAAALLEAIEAGSAFGQGSRNMEDK